MAIIRDDDWIQGDFEWTPDHFFSFQRFVPRVSALAFTSLLLTVFNVLFVSIGAIAMFRIKEVLPVEKTVFWSDLKVARRIVQGTMLEECWLDYHKMKPTMTLLGLSLRMSSLLLSTISCIGVVDKCISAADASQIYFIFVV